MAATNRSPTDKGFAAAMMRFRSSPWRWLVGALAIVVSVGVLAVLLYSASVHAVAGTPDGATALLEGSSIQHGNLALQGWALSLDSFWLLDATVYAVALAVSGLGLDLLHVVPVVLAILVIGLSAWLARQGRRGAAGVAGVAVVIGLVALPSPDLAYYLLQGPWHIATAFYCLSAFTLLRSGRFDWRWILAVVLLGASLLGDLLGVAFGILPCLFGGLVVAARRRRPTAGVSLSVAGVAAVVFALAVDLLARAFGTFTLVNRNLVIRLPRVYAEFRHLGNRLPALLGVGRIALPGLSNGAAFFQVLRFLGLALVVVAVVVALFDLLRGVVRGRSEAEDSWRINDLLVLAIVADLVFFIWGSPSGNLQYAKYLTATVLFAVLLGARLAARLVAALRSPRLIAGTLAAMAVVLGGYGVELGIFLTRPAPAQPIIALDHFLVAHGLRQGLGDYWSASLVTVGTGGEVQVRPVSTTGEHIRRFERQSALSWYQGQQFNFLVYDTARPWHDVNAKTAQITFGPPSQVDRVGTYRILVWSHSFSVSLVVPSYGSPLHLLW